MLISAKDANYGAWGIESWGNVSTLERAVTEKVIFE